MASLPDKPSKGDGSGVAVQNKQAQKVKAKRPQRYKVILLNDDFTPMDFVVDVLMRFFRKSKDEAARLMMQIHEQGAAICGVFPLEVAEAKVLQVIESARQHEYPLQATLERE